MLSWIIQITVVSIILVFLVHHLINFFKATLTVPKIKDLVNSPTQKYENMLNIIQNNSNNSNTSYDEYKIIDLLPKNELLRNEVPKNEEPNMKSELKNFLKKQLSTASSGTDISALDSMLSVNSYSSYK
jgi:hypothetical protein